MQQHEGVETQKQATHTAILDFLVDVSFLAPHCCFQYSRYFIRYMFSHKNVPYVLSSSLIRHLSCLFYGCCFHMLWLQLLEKGLLMVGNKSGTGNRLCAGRRHLCFGTTGLKISLDGDKRAPDVIWLSSRYEQSPWLLYICIADVCLEVFKGNSFTLA